MRTQVETHWLVRARNLRRRCVMRRRATSPARAALYISYLLDL